MNWHQKKEQYAKNKGYQNWQEAKEKISFAISFMSTARGRVEMVEQIFDEVFSTEIPVKFEDIPHGENCKDIRTICKKCLTEYLQWKEQQKDSRNGTEN